MTEYAQIGKCDKCDSPLIGIVLSNEEVVQIDCAHCHSDKEDDKDITEVTSVDIYIKDSSLINRLLNIGINSMEQLDDLVYTIDITQVKGFTSAMEDSILNRLKAWKRGKDINSFDRFPKNGIADLIMDCPCHNSYKVKMFNSLTDL